jgi:hypothetical protein
MSLGAEVLRELIRRVRKPLGCSGCRRTKDEVGHLVAGPGVYICESCVRRAADGLKMGLEVQFKRRCSFCGKTTRIAPLGENTRQAVCGECTGLILNVLRQAELQS